MMGRDLNLRIALDLFISAMVIFYLLPQSIDCSLMCMCNCFSAFRMYC